MSGYSEFSAELNTLRKKFEPRIQSQILSNKESALAKQLTYCSTFIKGESPLYGRSMVDFVKDFLNFTLPDSMFEPRQEVNLISSDEEEPDDYPIDDLVKGLQINTSSEVPERQMQIANVQSFPSQDADIYYNIPLLDNFADVRVTQEPSTSTVRDEIDMELSNDEELQNVSPETRMEPSHELSYQQPAASSSTVTKKPQIKRVKFNLNVDYDDFKIIPPPTNDNTATPSESPVHKKPKILPKTPKMEIAPKFKPGKLKAVGSYVNIAEGSKERKPLKLPPKPQAFTDAEEEKLNKIREKLKKQNLPEQPVRKIEIVQCQTKVAHARKRTTVQDLLKHPKDKDGSKIVKKEKVPAPNQMFRSRELEERLVRDADDIRAERMADKELVDDNFEMDDEYKDLLELMPSP